MLAAGREERKVLQKRKTICLLLIFLWESLEVEGKTTAGAIKLAAISGSQNRKDNHIQNVPDFGSQVPQP